MEHQLNPNKIQNLYPYESTSEKMSNNAKWAFPSVEGVVVCERKKEIEHEVNTCIVPLIYMNM